MRADGSCPNIGQDSRHRGFDVRDVVIERPRAIRSRFRIEVIPSADVFDVLGFGLFIAREDPDFLAFRTDAERLLQKSGQVVLIGAAGHVFAYQTCCFSTSSPTDACGQGQSLRLILNEGRLLLPLRSELDGRNGRKVVIARAAPPPRRQVRPSSELREQLQ